MKLLKGVLLSVLGLALGCGMTCSDKQRGAAVCAPKSCCAACPLQADEGVHPDSSNWRTLFNLNLDNAVFNKGVWFINERGDMTANKDEAIWSDRDYEKFVLDLEYMCDPAANSGVLIYCTDMANWIPNALEVQILDDNNPHWAKEKTFAKNGGLFGMLPPKVNNVRPAGEWNRMTITAQGQKIMVAVNGEITVDADLGQWTVAKKNPDGTDMPSWLSSKPWAEMPTKGRIGLQGKHGNAAIYFRNVRIKEL
ncbi:MAG: DUF1080 domain-containing protein [Kiritimatiellae bacterium]|nr:DUF1080 domain-containing protein [Kiritimatiellia bacterium]